MSRSTLWLEGPSKCVFVALAITFDRVIDDPRFGCIPLLTKKRNLFLHGSKRIQVGKNNKRQCVTLHTSETKLEEARDHC